MRGLHELAVRGCPEAQWAVTHALQVASSARHGQWVLCPLMPCMLSNHPQLQRSNNPQLQHSVQSAYLLSGQHNRHVVGLGQLLQLLNQLRGLLVSGNHQAGGLAQLAQLLLARGSAALAGGRAEAQAGSVMEDRVTRQVQAAKQLGKQSHSPTGLAELTARLLPTWAG